MEAAYLVYSSYIAALGEKLRRAQQGMLPCHALRSFSFSLFQSTGIPDLHSMAKSTNSVGAPVFCYAYLQHFLRVVWLKHQHMRVKNI